MALPLLILINPANAVGTVNLNSASNYQVLSGVATTISASVIGLDPANVGVSIGAAADLQSAISTITSLPGIDVAADLGGHTYLSGAYRAPAGTAFAMTTNVVLDAENKPDASFIFITPAAMNTTAGVNIILVNGAQACNIYWVAGAAITIGASNNISGNFLSSAAITIGASTSISGRLLAMEAVTVGASVEFKGFSISQCQTPKGGLSISVPDSVHIRNLDPGEVFTASMGEVSVTDSRDLPSANNWDVTVMASSMSDGAGHLIGSDLIKYEISNLAGTGGNILTSHNQESMSAPFRILSAVGGSNPNGATWIPTLTLNIPTDQVAGTYNGQISYSVY